MLPLRAQVPSRPPNGAIYHGRVRSNMSIHEYQDVDDEPEGPEMTSLALSDGASDYALPSDHQPAHYQPLAVHKRHRPPPRPAGMVVVHPGSTLDLDHAEIASTSV